MENYTSRVYIGKENFDDAFAVRKAVFVDEQGFFDEFDEIDSYALHAVIYHNGTPIGCGRIFPEDGNAHLGRIAVLAPFRNKGIGRMIMQALEAAANDHYDFKLFSLSAQWRAIGFYEALGYEQVGESYLDEGYPHITMIKKR